MLEGWDLTIKKPDFSVPVMRSVKELFPNLEELILKGVQYEPNLLGYRPVTSPLLSRLRALRICEDSRTHPRGLNAVLRCCASLSSLTSLDVELSDFGETDFGGKLSLAKSKDCLDYDDSEETINVDPLRRLRHLKSLTLQWVFPEVIKKVLVGLEGLLPRLETLELYGFDIPPMQVMTMQGTLRSLSLEFCRLDISFFGCMQSLQELSLLDSIKCEQGDINLSLASVMSTLSGIGSLRRLYINLDPSVDSILEFDGREREAAEWASQIPEFDLMRARGVQITVQ
ncbi:hypothetical protein DUNSADRAFT_18067 [Dunaliella salina]|uniref:Encoded protein n=1 Tax=Dunaliella salina TaxID=3046 RepID=A0ABQ7GZJ9_DUNSA|nr:hypothetical protein DUNSADRAFT_18067 [Dunaliella salina]|eukprot:KAF5840030.1 hypothetical protein DUNSADRAFT_18067 [Dunaliella salina]